MTVSRRAQFAESVAILEVMTDALLAASSASNHELHRLVGQLMSYAELWLANGTMGTKLGECFETAYLGGVTLAASDVVRQRLMLESPTSVLGETVRQTGILMSLSITSRAIIDTEFRILDDVQAVLDQTLLAIEDTKHIVTDDACYLAFNQLSAAVVHHLSDSLLQLPRRSTFSIAASMPSLYLANRIYADTTRSDELAADNNVIHPAFCPRELRILTE